MKNIVRKVFPMTLEKLRKMDYEEARREIFGGYSFLSSNLAKRDRYILDDYIGSSERHIFNHVNAFVACILTGSFQRFLTVFMNMEREYSSSNFIFSMHDRDDTYLRRSRDDLMAICWDTGRKYDYFWSSKKKRSLHDKYSREITYEKLKKENKSYNLRKYEKVIPEGAKQYLIKDSASLAIEGMNQKHCVASYGRRVKLGDCAIASVVLNDARWTVELRIDYKGELDIQQIKGLQNTSADKKVKEEIYKKFGLEYNDSIYNSPLLQAGYARHDAELRARLFEVEQEIIARQQREQALAFSREISQANAALLQNYNAGLGGNGLLADGED